MIVLIGMLTGIWDLGSMILMFEAQRDDEEPLRDHGGAAQPGDQADGLDGLHLRQHRRDHPLDRDRALLLQRALLRGTPSLSAFVYTIIPTLFVFFNAFAVNMVLQYKKVGRWKDYLFGERAYIVQS